MKALVEYIPLMVLFLLLLKTVNLTFSKLIWVEKHGRESVYNS